MALTLLIWARLLLVTDWQRSAVCAVPPASTNANASWHAGGCASNYPETPDSWEDA